MRMWASSPGPTWPMEKNNSRKLSSDFQKHIVTYAWTHAYTHAYIQFLKKNGWISNSYLLVPIGTTISICWKAQRLEGNKWRWSCPLFLRQTLFSWPLPSILAIFCPQTSVQSFTKKLNSALSLSNPNFSNSSSSPFWLVSLVILKVKALSAVTQTFGTLLLPL